MRSLVQFQLEEAHENGFHFFFSDFTLLFVVVCGDNDVLRSIPIDIDRP